MKIRIFFLLAAMILQGIVIQAKENNIRLRLCIFGDIQPQILEPVTEKNIPQLLKKGAPLYYVQKTYQLANKLGTDAYLIAGDIANYNEPGMYDLFRKLYDDSVRGMKNPPLFLPVMGNHDFWGTFWIKSSHDGMGKLPETRAARKEIFKKHLKIKDIHHHVVINGYDVIGYSIEGGMFVQYDAVKEIEKMIKKAVARDPGKPIILYAHNHTGHTVRQSGSNHNFYKMLSKYPQVIYFSGHTHVPLEDERTIHQKDFTSVGTSALLNVNPIPPRDSLPYGERHLGKHMLYVTIDDKEVVIRRYQLRDNSEILDNGKPWTLPLPLVKENFTYTAEKRPKTAPAFPENAGIKAEIVRDSKKAFSGVKITCTAAVHPNAVFAYVFDVFEQNGKDWIYRDPVFKGKPVKRKMLFPGDQYKGRNFLKNTLIANIPLNGKSYLGFAFESGKTYKIEVTALDALETPSRRKLSTIISIPAK